MHRHLFPLISTGSVLFFGPKLSMHWRHITIVKTKNTVGKLFQSRKLDRRMIPSHFLKPGWRSGAQMEPAGPKMYQLRIWATQLPLPAHKTVICTEEHPLRNKMEKRMKHRYLAYVLKKPQDRRHQQIVMFTTGNKNIYDRFQQVFLNNVTLDIIILKVEQ